MLSNEAKGTQRRWIVSTKLCQLHCVNVLYLPVLPATCRHSGTGKRCARYLFLQEWNIKSFDIVTSSCIAPQDFQTLLKGLSNNSFSSFKFDIPFQYYNLFLIFRLYQQHNKSFQILGKKLKRSSCVNDLRFSCFHA